jgi:hypothetical protein
MRARQVAAIDKVLAAQHSRKGLARDPLVSAAGLSLILDGIGRALVMEGALGITSGHADARHWVEQWLEQLEADAGAEPPGT